MPGVSRELAAGLRAQWIGSAREGALLVVGASERERADAIDWLIQAILCEDAPEARPCGACWSCRQLASDRHPDLHALQSDLERIGVDEIRDLAGVLNLTAHRGGRKVGWIPRADRLTDGAANAFLKTLEEPPGPTVFILETSRPRSLQATIRSRCERIRIQIHHSAPGAGSPLNDDQEKDARRSMIEDYARLLDGEIGPLDLEKHRSSFSLAEMAHDWSLWLASAAKSKLGWPVRPEVPDPLRVRLERLSLATLLPLYTQARETERLARTSANEKLAREALLVKIFLGGGHDGRERQVT
ncbi:MAG: hypothetical protein ACYCS1_06145 [Gammaproteobacteria bacterium]